MVNDGIIMKDKELVRFIEGENPKITIIDSIMGSGKTSWAIQSMNNCDIERKYIYITPYLDEVQRIKNSVTSRKFYEPTNKNQEGSKMYDFEKLLKQGKDIVSTHALFKSIKPELIEILSIRGYTLILDEVMNVIDTMIISKDDYTTLINQQIISIKGDGKIQWNKNCIDYDGKFNEYKYHALNNTLYKHTRSNGGKYELLVWTFPVSIFKVFSKVYILTYLYKGQLQKYYFDMFNVEYG